MDCSRPRCLFAVCVGANAGGFQKIGISSFATYRSCQRSWGHQPGLGKRCRQNTRHHPGPSPTSDEWTRQVNAKLTFHAALPHPLWKPQQAQSRSSRHLWWPCRGLQRSSGVENSGQRKCNAPPQLRYCHLGPCPCASQQAPHQSRVNTPGRRYHSPQRHKDLEPFLRFGRWGRGRAGYRSNPSKETGNTSQARSS